MRAHAYFAARARAAFVVVAWAACAIPASALSTQAQEPRPGTDPLLLDSTAAQAFGGPIVIRVVPENPRVVGGSDPQASPTERTVGDPFWATVRTSGPPGYLLLPQSLVDAYHPHPELAILETDRRDGQLRLRLAVFRPGDVVLPVVEARVLTDRGDTLLVHVRSDTIRVASVLAPGDTLLADIKPLWRPRGVPAWVWALAALLAALAALAWWLRRRRKPPSALVARAPGDPYAEARRAIEQVRRDLPAAASARARTAAAAAIGDALRGYLADGWGVAARERTTLELLPALPEDALAERPALAAVLATVDLAKFARVAPESGTVPALADRGLIVLDRLEERRRSLAVADEGEGASRPSAPEDARPISGPPAREAAS